VSEGGAKRRRSESDSTRLLRRICPQVFASKRIKVIRYKLRQQNQKHESDQKNYEVTGGDDSVDVRQHLIADCVAEVSNRDNEKHSPKYSLSKSHLPCKAIEANERHDLDNIRGNIQRNIRRT